VQNVELNFDNLFENKMSMQFSKSIAEPGENVSLSIKTDADSVAAICVVDQSVRLLKEPNELTVDSVKNQLLSLRLFGYYPNDLYTSFIHGYVERPDALVRLHVKNLDFFILSNFTYVIHLFILIFFLLRIMGS
jgi:hypothetical protein